jgi:hypothetical protein
MNDAEIKTDLTSFSLMKDLDYNDFIKYSIFQILKAQLEDVVKYAFAVENLEILLVDVLDEEYYKKVETKMLELEQKYGIKKKPNL